MMNFSERIAALSPEKRALLELRVKKQSQQLSSFPLSFAQQRLWFIDQLDPGSILYNIPLAVRLHGRLDISALERTLSEIIRRHEVLRTTFPMIDGRPMQVIRTPERVKLPIFDLQGFAENEREAEAQRLATQEAQCPFDLAKGPVLRAKLLRLGAEDHVVLVTMHHITSDGWSTGVLVREVATLYTAFITGEDSPLPDLSIQYADYAKWQREWLQGSVLESDLDYWKQQLSGAPSVLELPTDHPRPAVQSFRGGRQSFRLTGEVAEALKALGHSEGTTLFMTLLTAFKVLLSRYTSRDDIIVGSPIAGRNRAETEDLIGFFVNTLVLRTDTSGNPSFRELLQRVREITLGAYAHQDVPFEKLVEELQPERNLSHTPLFQVVFVLQNAPQGALELPGLSLSPISYENPTAKFDLTLTMVDTEQGLVGGFEYNIDLFETATIERMIAHFGTLLRAIATQPDLPIAQLPLLAEDERRLLASWNTSTDKHFSDACLHRMFEEQVERAPDATAMVCDQEQLTYRELNSRANQVAHRLQSLGVGPDTLVALLMERSSELIIGLLAILKAGGAYVPLDPTYPSERLDFMLKDAGVGVLLTEESLAASVSASDVRVICLDTEWPSIESESTDNPESSVSAENLAYVIYTSGSTGQPKGALIPHSNVVRLFSATQQWFNFTEKDVWTFFHSHAFDFSVWEIWGALLYGGRLVVVPYWLSRSPEAFHNLLSIEGVTVLSQTPSAFRQLIQVDETATDSHDLQLRLVIFGGEALEFNSLKPWLARHGEQSPQLVNMYGITETTVHVTYRPVLAADIHETSGSKIGIAIPDLQLYVLDQELEFAPIGIPGELYVGGAGLARGYLNRAELTAERFIPHPFSSEAGARLYRTGDLARYLPSGDVEYLGRADQQVKIRGFRIELGEIEAVLASHDAVRESVVMARAETSAEKRLIAYVVAQREVTAKELREHLRARLPEYMVPAAIVQLSEMPLTNNGKLDRKALPAPEEIGHLVSESYVAPRTAIEELLCGIWSEVLGVEQVGVEANFFDLGGDSIRTIQVRANAQSVGLNFTVQQLFRHQTIAELAAEISKSEPGYLPTPQTVPFSLLSEEDRQRLPSDLDDAYPLAMLQAGMLFHSQYSPGAALYHVVSTVRLRAPFDAANIRAAVQQLASRHPVLRTSFDLANYTEPLQLVHRVVDVPLQIDDLRHLSTAEQDEVITGEFESEKLRPFDPERAPLVRFRVARRSEDDFQLTWAEHHAILDGWSVATMMTELLQLYLALCGESSAPAPPPAVAYRDFVALERQSLESEECRNFWTEKLRDSAMTMIPRWPSLYATAQTHRLRSRPVALNNETNRNLRRLASTLRVPIKSVLLAAHLRVLSLLSGQEDTITGIAANGRPEETDGERVLGLFLNLLPIRVQVSGGTWATLVRQTFESEREVMPYRRFPMAEMQRMHELPLFETAFNYTHFHVYERVQEVEGVEALEARSYQTTNFTFAANFSVDPASSHLQLDVESNNPEISEEQLDAIGGYYAQTLSAMASNPYGRYEKHLLLSEHEQHQQLYVWNETETDIIRDHHIHDLFEAHAEQTPGAIALIFGEEQITYEELNQRANQLAHHLLELGVTPESRVGLCCSRSVELIVGLLGILKAGGAFVPMDPAYPQERLSFMLEDTQIAVLLTQEQLVDDLPSNWTHTILLDADWETIATADKENPDVVLSGGNAAYVIYTSGSTGIPKGIVVSHEALVNRMSSIVDLFPVGPESSFLQFASIGFDAFVQEVFSTLSCGARLALHPHPTRLTPAELFRECEQVGITILQLPPPYWYQMTDHLAQSRRSVPESLKLVATGGEAPSAEKLTTWTELTRSQLKYINAYGPAEATVTTTAYTAPLDVAALKMLAKVPMGQPLANTQIYLLDPHLQPVPVGTSGELYLGGIGLARGYHNRPELTAERFIPHPFSRQAGARLYRTGDLARYLPTGDVEFLGRTDEQVKIRGARIELGEIEAVLTSHAAVREAAVVARDEQRDDRVETTLVAYVVGQSEVSWRELREYLRVRLPDYMVPSAFVALKQMPLTHHCKIDRHALPAPEQIQNEAESYLAPRTPLEEMLAGIWAEVLRFERVGIHDNFFDAGGHSLLATQVMSRLSHVCQVELPLRLLFESPTIAGLAASIEATMTGGHGLQAPPIQRVSRDHPLPVSFGQQRLWFLDKLTPNSSAYNFPVAVRMQGTLDVAALDQTLNEVRRRHEVMRSTFRMRDGEPVQVIAPFEPVASLVVDLSDLTETERESHAQRLVAEEAQKPFNLADGPLLRTTLVRLGEEDHVMLLTMHHIITDGWSMNVLTREVATLYAAFCNGQPSPLPELSIQYADFANWQRNWLQGEVLEEQLGYWMQQIGDARVMELPTDRPRPAVETHRGANASRLLSESLSSSLVELCRREGVTMFMTLLAAFKALLYRYTGQQDILVGTPIVGRKQRETEDLIGFFVNTLVLRSQLHSDLTFRDLLKRVMEATLGAFAHQDVPFEKLVQELDPNRDLSRQPLFQVVFMVNNGAPEVLEMPGLVLSGMQGTTNTAKFDLIVAIGETDQGLNVNFEYNTDLFDDSTITRLAEYFERLLESVVGDPDQRLIDVKLITEGDVVIDQPAPSVNDEAEEFDFQF